jgi:hypothetical protein
MTIDADDITYQVKSSEAAGRRLMKDRRTGYVFWATSETVVAAELQNEEPVPFEQDVGPDDRVEVVSSMIPEGVAAPTGREFIPEFLRDQPKRPAPRRRKVNGS